MKIYIFGVIVIVTLIFCLIFWQQIADAILMVGTVASVLVGVAGVGGLFFGAWYLRERMRITRAARIEAEKQANVMVVTSGNQVFIRETDHNANWRAAHLDPRFYANGRYSEPTPTEANAYAVFHAPRLAQGSVAQLPETIEADPLDLPTVFTQPTQSYAIIGGQQTGKTYQARHIANFWIGRNIKPLVIGPKWDKGEWGGCILLGGNGNFSAVGVGITIIRRIVEARHAANKSHKEHKILPVFFDDWTPIVDAVPNARALVLEATTLYASVNVLLYFVLHSDTANAWGVDRKGAALKDNFVKLFIVPAYNMNGLIVRDRTRGYIRFAGEAVDRPARLFTAPPLMLGPAQVHNLPVVLGANEQEKKILDLKAAGTSYNEICRQVYGAEGGKQIQMVKKILAKYQVPE
jgi:hypothetical protein